MAEPTLVDLSFNENPREPVSVQLGSAELVAHLQKGDPVIGIAPMSGNEAQDSLLLNTVAAAEEIGMYVGDMCWRTIRLQPAEGKRGYENKAVYKSNDKLWALYKVSAITA